MAESHLSSTNRAQSSRGPARWIVAVALLISVAFGLRLFNASRPDRDDDPPISPQAFFAKVTPKPRRAWNAPFVTPLGTTKLEGTPTLLGAQFSRGGGRLVGMQPGGKIVVWNVADGHRIAALSAGAKGGYFATPSDDGVLIATGESTSSSDFILVNGAYRLKTKLSKRTPIVLRNIDSKELFTSLKRDRPAYDVIFTPDSKSLIQLVGDGSLDIWNLSSGTRAHTLQPSSKTMLMPGTLSMDISRDSKLLACSYSDHSVRIWDLHSGKLLGHSLVRKYPRACPRSS